MARSKSAIMAASVEQTVIDTETALQGQSPGLSKGGEAPIPESADEEAAILAHEGEDALREMGERQLEPPAPFDLGGEHVPEPGDDVEPYDKISEGLSGKQEAAHEAAQTAGSQNQETGKEDAPPAGQSQPGKPEQQEAGAEDTQQEWEKPLSEIEPKKERKPRTEKPKPATEKKTPNKEEAPAPPPEPEQPQGPKDAPRSNEPEQIVYINLSELHAFKNHPFQVRDDADMKAMVESVKTGGVNQPAIVRPRAEGGYEIVSGHRRHKASELAGYTDMPCIVRNLSDDEAVLKMAEDNINQRQEMLPSERAKMLKMQLEAIKHQGARDTSGQLDPRDAGKRSNEIVAERNNMTVKQVQRYIRLDELVPDLLKMADEKKIAFTPAVELSYIKPKNQRYIAVAIEGQQAGPSLSQAQRMRELDQKGMLNGDIVDGIMLEEKKEVDKVIISSQELSQYFGKDRTPREMKEQIIKLLDEWKGKQPEHSKQEKKQEQEK
jgi:ParB family chromosome partitioning protein